MTSASIVCFARLCVYVMEIGIKSTKVLLHSTIFVLFNLSKGHCELPIYVLVAVLIKPIEQVNVCKFQCF